MSDKPAPPEKDAEVRRWYVTRLVKAEEVVLASAYDALAAKLKEAEDDVNYLLKCLQGISHWTGCLEKLPCERCRREQAEAALAEAEKVVEVAKDLIGHFNVPEELWPFSRAYGNALAAYEKAKEKK